jgi:hypothetical protein
LRRENILPLPGKKTPGPTARGYTDYAIPNPLSTDINICTLKTTKIQDRSHLGTSDILLKSNDVLNTQPKSLTALCELTVTVTY